jgi:hypothetical protein
MARTGVAEPSITKLTRMSLIFVHSFRQRLVVFATECRIYRPADASSRTRTYRRLDRRRAQPIPGFRFSLIGTPDGYGNQVRFSWQLGPEGSDGPIKGTDFATLENGRLASVVGFLDEVPTTA